MSSRETRPAQGPRAGPASLVAGVTTAKRRGAPPATTLSIDRSPISKERPGRGEAATTMKHYGPENVHWGMVPPLTERTKKIEKKAAIVARARRDFDAWAQNE